MNVYFIYNTMANYSNPPDVSDDDIEDMIKLFKSNSEKYPKTNSNHPDWENTDIKDKFRDSLNYLILNDPTQILCPAARDGSFIKDRMDMSDFFPYYECKFELYEPNKSTFPPVIDESHIIRQNFFSAEPCLKSYDTIICNPKFKKITTYMSYIRKCYRLLFNGGELIFTIPYRHFTNSMFKACIKHMMTHGAFTHIIEPEGSKEILFRYCKNGIPNNIINYNDKQVKFIINESIKFVSEESP